MLLVVLLAHLAYELRYRRLALLCVIRHEVVELVQADAQVGDVLGLLFLEVLALAVLVGSVTWWGNILDGRKSRRREGEKRGGGKASQDIAQESR